MTSAPDRERQFDELMKPDLTTPSTLAKTNSSYWISKINRNRNREKTDRRLLKLKGWDILSIWECDLRCHDKVYLRLKRAS